MRAIGIILAGGNNEGRLGALTDCRAASALPIGSCYRAIDFTLSNMSRSQIRKVAVLAQYNSRSLQDHLSSSKWWDFGRKQGGLFVLTPFTRREDSDWFRGTADSIYQNISFLKRSNEPYVVITSGDSIYRMDYQEILNYHTEKGADITVACRNMEGEDLTKFGIMELDANKQVLEFEEKPLQPQFSMASLGIYVMSRTLLIDLLETLIPEGRYDFVKDIIIRFRKTLKIYGYEFDGYWRGIGSGIKDYFDCNMDFLQKDVRDHFLNQYPYVESKPKDEPPAKYNTGAMVRNCITGSGSIFNGVIENSVIFRRVFTGEHSIIRNAIIMEGSHIGNHCVIENAILDKNVTLADGTHILGTPQEIVVLKKNAMI